MDPARPSFPAGCRPSQHGFSLVELIVTISLAAILAAVGVPMYRESVGNARLTGQANELVAAINLARSQSITLNQPVLFCRAASEAATTCAGSPGDWTFWLIRTNGGAVVRRGAVQTHGGAVDVTSNFTNDQVSFSSDGLARTNNVLMNGQALTLCSVHSTSNNRRVVTLGRGSRVSTTRTSGACT